MTDVREHVNYYGAYALRQRSASLQHTTERTSDVLCAAAAEKRPKHIRARFGEYTPLADHVMIVQR